MQLINRLPSYFMALWTAWSDLKIILQWSLLQSGEKIETAENNYFW